MKVEKKIIANLTKCYSVAPLHKDQKDFFLVAAEKVDRCILFDEEGNEKETLWTEPGGVMSMVQVPRSNGQFLATHKFYSPNDSKEAKIVIVTPVENGHWEIRTLVELPHVHRFDIVERNGIHYLIVCTLKSGHEYKEDWSMPGKVYAAVLPDDLSGYNENNQLQLSVIKDDMLRNHGYYKVNDGSKDTCIISSQCGVFRFIPPAVKGEDWEIEELLDTPASDAVMVDFDEDGELELAVLSPFHGDQISIYKKEQNKFREIYAYENKTEFTHAIYGGSFGRKNVLIVGHRQGARDLLIFTYNKDTKNYEVKVIDHECGPANIYHYVREGKDILVATNREIDEVAMYEISDV